MRKVILLLTVMSIYLITKVYAQQTIPDCSNLSVISIEMDNDTNDLMKITIANNCPDCASGINGPVYCELRVIQTTPVFDTIAASYCWCLMTPQNNDSYTYSIDAIQTNAPALGTFYVQLLGACDSLTLNLTSGIEDITNSSPSIYPNPAIDIIKIKKGMKPGQTIIITDILGNILYQSIYLEGENVIDISLLSPGSYFIRFSGIETPTKFIKQ